MWASLKESFLPQAFVIDEPREAVFLAERSPKPEGEEAAAPTATVDLAGDDLLAQVSRLLLDQIRLEQKAKMLEAGDRNDDEFSRFIRHALPFIDTFWRVLEMARDQPPSEELKNWLASIEALYFRLVKLLENYGFVFINSLGNEVNLDYHEVIEYRPSAEYPHNHVMKELEKGVVFRGRLLREAKVAVAYRP